MPNPIFKTGKSKYGFTLVSSSLYQEVNKQLKGFLNLLGTMQEAEWEKKQFGHRFATEAITFAQHIKRIHDDKWGGITLG